MTTLEILKRARERISDPQMWIQRAIGTSSGPNCMYGAVVYSAPGCENRSVAFKALMRALPYPYTIAQGDSSIITTFNDRTDTFHEDVLEVFDRAIAKLEAEMTLPGKSKTIIVEPIKTPAVVPAPKSIPPVKQPVKV